MQAQCTYLILSVFGHRALQPLSRSCRRNTGHTILDVLSVGRGDTIDTVRCEQQAFSPFPAADLCPRGPLWQALHLEAVPTPLWNLCSHAMPDSAVLQLFCFDGAGGCMRCNDRCFRFKVYCPEMSMQLTEAAASSVAGT